MSGDGLRELVLIAAQGEWDSLFGGEDDIGINEDGEL